MTRRVDNCLFEQHTSNMTNALLSTVPVNVGDQSYEIFVETNRRRAAVFTELVRDLEENGFELFWSMYTESLDNVSRELALSARNAGSDLMRGEMLTNWQLGAQLSVFLISNRTGAVVNLRCRPQAQGPIATGLPGNPRPTSRRGNRAPINRLALWVRQIHGQYHADVEKKLNEPAGGFDLELIKAPLREWEARKVRDALVQNPRNTRWDFLNREQARMGQEQARLQFDNSAHLREGNGRLLTLLRREMALVYGLEESIVKLNVDAGGMFTLSVGFTHGSADMIRSKLETMSRWFASAVPCSEEDDPDADDDTSWAQSQAGA